MVTSHTWPKDKVSPPNSSREPGPSQLTLLLGQAPAAFLLCSPLRSRLHPSHRSSASMEPLLAPQEARTAGSPQKGMASQWSTGIFQLTRTVIGWHYSPFKRGSPAWWLRVWSETASVHILSLLLTSCVTLGKSLASPFLIFLICKMYWPPRAVRGIGWVHICKVLILLPAQSKHYMCLLNKYNQEWSKKKATRRNALRGYLW